MVEQHCATAGSPRLVLVGPSKAGKTTVGRILAARLGLAFRDTDLDVERASGLSVAGFYRKYGEERFRVWERSACLTAIDEFDGILSLGGGAVLDPETQRALRRCGRVILLSLSVDEAFERTRIAKSLDVLPPAQIEKITRRVPLRLEAGRSLGVPEISTEGRSVERVVRLCLDEMYRRGWARSDGTCHGTTE